MNKTIKIICKICGKEFSDFRSNHRKFCSNKCGHIALAIYNTGKHRSEETKRKIGKANAIALKGKWFPFQFQKGCNPPRKYFTEEARITGARLKAREWWNNHREKARLYRKKSKALRRMRTKGLSLKVIQSIYEENIKQYGTLTCYLCLEPIKFGNDTLEHKIPLSRGGSHSKENLTIACMECNRKKNALTEIEYKEKIKCALLALNINA